MQSFTPARRSNRSEVLEKSRPTALSVKLALTPEIFYTLRAVMPDAALPRSSRLRNDRVGASKRRLFSHPAVSVSLLQRREQYAKDKMNDRWSSTAPTVSPIATEVQVSAAKENLWQRPNRLSPSLPYPDQLVFLVTCRE